MSLRLRALLVILFLSLSALAVNIIEGNGRGATESLSSLQNSPPQAATLKPELRAKGEELLAQTDEGQRARLVLELARADASGAMEFLLAVLSTDPSARVRRAVIDGLGTNPHPKVREALERHAATDPDVGVSRLALERLRVQRNIEMRSLLVRRMELARSKGDDAGLRQLAQEQERWISLVRGTMLPSFMRVPPSCFALKADGKPVRVLAFGDFGTGTENQKQVATAMLGFHKKSPFDFAITLGDNFYSLGMESPTDPRWKTWWDDLYNPLGIKFYATMGNHDWGYPDSPAAELLYARQSPSWQMPAPYYTFTAGSIQFFALDTNEVSEAQLIWLKEELDKSRARWKLVYGHHPIYSAGQHGNNISLIGRLLPVLKGRADVYLAGHDHDLQHLKPEGALHLFVSGGGGAGIRVINPGERSLFAKSSYGFSVLDATATELKVTFISSASEKLYEYTLHK
jgi:predicted phosphodiesterase